MQYIESITGGTDSISKNSMLNTPLPVVVFRGDNGEVVWANQGFSALSEAPDDVFSMRIEDLAPDFDYRWLLDGNTGEELEELTEIGGGPTGSTGTPAGRPAGPPVRIRSSPPTSWTSPRAGTSRPCTSPAAR